MNSYTFLKYNTMQKILLLTSTLIILFSCDNNKKLNNINILPQAKHINKENKEVLLSIESKLYSPQSEVYPLLKLFIEEIYKITGITLHTTNSKKNEANLVFEIDTSMMKEESLIKVNKTIKVFGGSYMALARAKSTLLQIVKKKVII